jgi:hypothetical protein
MMTAIELIAGVVSLVIAAIAVLHLAWAAGVIWPASSEAALSRAVVGSKRLTGMPPRHQSLMVALALLAAALWPLMWAGLVLLPVPQSLVWLGMWALAAIFLARGFAGYSAAFRVLFGEEPFNSYNRRYYSPLSVAIGGGLLALIVLARY